MGQLAQIPEKLTEAIGFLGEANSLIKYRDSDKQKAALARAFLVREAILKVLEQLDDDKTAAIHSKCLQDIVDLAYAVHDVVVSDSFDSAHLILSRYQRIVTDLILYFRVGPLEFQKIDDTIESSIKAGPEDIIGFVSLQHSAELLFDLLMEIGSLQGQLKDQTIEDSILRGSIPIEIIALRERLWKITGDVLVDRYHVQDDTINMFREEMWDDQLYIGDIIDDFHKDGKSAMGMLFLQKTIDMAIKFQNFCQKNEDPETLKGPFIAIENW